MFISSHCKTLATVLITFLLHHSKQGGIYYRPASAQDHSCQSKTKQFLFTLSVFMALLFLNKSYTEKNEYMEEKNFHFSKNRS